MADDLDLGGEFFALLEQLDEGMMRRVAEEGCPRCGGPLHRGDYERKPRGALIAPEGETSVRRFSLCCGREGCRKRATPPSLRFLGRRVYLGAVVVMASIIALALRAAGEIRRQTGVPARTTRRWLGWWQGPFLHTEVFVTICARLIGVDVGRVPASIVGRFEGTWTPATSSSPSARSTSRSTPTAPCFPTSPASCQAQAPRMRSRFDVAATGTPGVGGTIWPDTTLTEPPDFRPTGRTGTIGLRRRYESIGAHCICCNAGGHAPARACDRA